LTIEHLIYVSLITTPSFRALNKKFFEKELEALIDKQIFPFFFYVSLHELSMAPYSLQQRWTLLACTQPPPGKRQPGTTTKSRFFDGVHL
jgi:hypothetical protein